MKLNKKIFWMNFALCFLSSISLSCNNRAIKNEITYNSKFDFINQDLNKILKTNFEVFSDKKIDDVNYEQIYVFVNNLIKKYNLNYQILNLIVNKMQNKINFKFNIAFNNEYISKYVDITISNFNFSSNVSDNEEADITKIRISNWNVLDYSKSSKEIKTLALASIINYLNVDLQGIIELNDEKALILLVTKLNELNPKANWKYIISNKKDWNPNLQANSKQHEYVGIIYKSSILKLKSFINGEEFLSYNNSTFVNYIQNEKIGYVRPPFGAFFETKGKIKNDFTFVINHFDSPRASKYETTINNINNHKIQSQGSQELEEALNLYNLMNWYDQLDGKNNELIFMADTNILEGNANVVFEDAINKGYISLIDDDKKNSTSLAQSLKKYSQPYDKIFYKGDLKYENVGFYPLYNIFEDKIIEDFDNLDKWIYYFNNTLKHSYSKDYGYIYYGISDHCPIYFDVILNKDDLD
ncbi:endonuclease/exonuclease/phosphatase family protein [Mycoplasmopsis lipofaciens]|uniref:endonuclease/exonuclease/phosphatase family protein n=1 Tax=Mycoplasmopsis lipofaciens TaxID=114884 RepID=UPI000482A2E0|nr:endonuclease/exonuclease/phosphatase family protein [Mycoplasmopsis lipofaciens]